MIPLSWTFDHVGPMTRTVADTAIMLQAIAGYDLAESTSRRMPIPDYTDALRDRVSSLRVGIAREFFFVDLDPEIEAAIKLIRRMSRENPLWGAPRIHGELLKLGIDVGETSVSKYMGRRRPPSQTWRTFLKNHLTTTVASCNSFGL